MHQIKSALPIATRSFGPKFGEYSFAILNSVKHAVRCDLLGNAEVFNAYSIGEKLPERKFLSENEDELKRPFLLSSFQIILHIA